MLNRPTPSSIQTRPRSNSLPVGPLRVQEPPETSDSVPVRPPRNPGRLPTLGEELLVPPPGTVSNPATASEDDRREGEIGNEGHNPTVNAPPSKSPVIRKPLAGETPLPQINTIDRKILQELKQAMLARSAQFALKNNTRHHPFPPNEVPYPRSYDHKCVDTDVWETVFCEQYCGNITFHTFDVPPTKVLDLGCGSGSWIMACARRWKNCHFVGLDIVPLHPDLGRSELGQRVNWVQANFLEPLPFLNEEFDFVHVKRIARGVPEQKWGALFEEILRVMKHGAVLEMVEEDLYIPGQTMDFTNDDASISTCPPDSPEESNRLHSMPRPSASLPDISAIYSGSQALRRSTSERHNERPLVTQAPSNVLPPPLPTQPTRVFPRMKPPKSTNRPIASHFKFQNLFPKRSGRDDGSGAHGEQLRKTKGDPIIPTPPVVLRRPGGGRSSSSRPYINTTRALSNLTLGSNTTINALPAPTQPPPVFEERVPPLSLPPVEIASEDFEIDFLQEEQEDEFEELITQLFSDTPPGDTGRWKPPANILSSQNSGFFHEEESVEPNEWDENLAGIPPIPPPKDIPARSNPLTIPLSSSSSEVSSSTGLSLSVPESRFSDHSDDEGRSFLTSVTSVPMKSLSTISLAITAKRSPRRAAPPLQSSTSNESSGADASSVTSPIAEMPPNPRQHKLLDVIYAEMHAARSVNLAPIGLIEDQIRAHFKNVCTRPPLIFAFPPPPGCRHRPEFDAEELRRGKFNQLRNVEHEDGLDRGLRHDINPSNLSPLISAFPLPPGCEQRTDSDDTPPYTRSLTPSSKVPQLKCTPPRHTRQRSRSVTSNDPGPSRARASSFQSSPSFPANPETGNHRSPRPKGSIFSLVPGDGTVPNWAVVPGEGLSAYAITNTLAASGVSPARVASYERERSRQRTDSLFTPPIDARGKGGGREARTKLPASALTLTRPSTAGSLPPPSSFVYKNPNLALSSPSIASSSSSTVNQHERGKRGLTVAERTLPDTSYCKKDSRTLSLHLRVRVVEILGCSEAMWEWVREFQVREFEKERKRKELAANTVQGFGGGRVAARHKVRVRNPGGRGGAGSGKPTPAPKTNPEVRSIASGSSREPTSPVTTKSTKDLLPLVTKTSGEKPPKARRAGGGRVSYFQQPVRSPARERTNSSGTDRPHFPSRGTGQRRSPSLYSKTSNGSGKSEEPLDRMELSVKQELLHMTRQRFDEILSWFQFDMDDSIQLTRAMTTRAACAPYSTEPGEQRKSFDDACQKLEDHLKLHPKLPSPLTRSSSGCTSSSGSPQNGRHGEEELCCLPPLLSLVHPSKRSSRTIRVWVAWKL